LFAAARAAVAQAATAVVDDRRAMFSPTTAGAPVVTAQDGPDVSSGYTDMAMAPQMMAMAPGMMGMAPESAPMAEMAPGVQVGSFQVLEFPSAACTNDTGCSHLVYHLATRFAAQSLHQLVLQNLASECDHEQNTSITCS